MSIVKDNSILRQVSTNCTDIAEINDIVNKLKSELEKTKNGLGLAAIQIGIPKRIAVIKSPSSKDGYLTLINPSIIEKDFKFIYVNEGCLSLPNHFQNTERYQDIFVSNYAIENNELIENKFVAFYSKESEYNYFSGEKDNNLLAICIQHEVDHFDGKLITDFDIKGETVVKGKKIGRNELCPCGSLKKWKKCCGK